MIETKIMNDMNANYLLIVSDEINGYGYENKMFEYNDIKGFLDFSISRINNNVTYQYKIMNYENLNSFFLNRTFDTEDIKKIFSSIISVGQRAMEYLLNTDSILLNPEYIFLNNDELMFCYYPGAGQSFSKGIRGLMEYILERLNHENQENVMMAYGLYQKILKNNFTMENLMEEFVKPKDVTPTENNTRLSKNQIQLTENKAQLVHNQDQPAENKVQSMKKTTLSENDRNMKEKMADMARLEEELDGKNGKKIKDKKKKEKGKGFLGFFDKKKPAKPAWEASPDTILLAEENPYGSTQLLNGKMLINQGSGKDILLADFPVHIGNMAGDSECRIDNIMVSRNHAVLTWECGIYYVEDNDSTNGTYVNGSRIPPYEPVQIKEGDMVCFANEKYCLN